MKLVELTILFIMFCLGNREIVVQFNADVADGMQWKFTPTQREVCLDDFPSQEECCDLLKCVF